MPQIEIPSVCFTFSTWGLSLGLTAKHFRLHSHIHSSSAVLIEHTEYITLTQFSTSLSVFSGASPVGLILTAIVGVAYKVAIRFEG